MRTIKTKSAAIYIFVLITSLPIIASAEEVDIGRANKVIALTQSIDNKD